MTNDSEWEQRVSDLWARFEAHEPAKFRAKVEALAAEQSPEDPRALFERACGNDSTGHPAEAAQLYHRALELGLTGLRRRRAVIQMASTLRNLGRAEESVALLTTEQNAPSDDLDDAIAAMLALALVDTGQERKAAAIAILALSRHLPRYNRSISNYAKALCPELF